MQRRRVQQKRKPSKKTISKKIGKKPPVSFSEMLLNWIIIILAGVVLVFFISLILKLFSNYDFLSHEELSNSEQTEKVQKIIRIEVLNGCGDKGIAAKFTDYLRARSFDVVNTGNYRNFEVDSSFVIDRRSLQRNYGNRLAESLGITHNRVEPILSEEMALEATLVLGKDYQSLRGWLE